METSAPTPSSTETAPSKSDLIAGITLGVLLLVAGVMLFVVFISAYVPDHSQYNYDPTPEPQQPVVAWYVWVAPLIAGLVTTVLCWNRFAHYYRDVSYGTVVRKYQYAPDHGGIITCHVEVEGPTLSGQLHTTSFTITDDEYLKVKAGDVYPFE